MWTEVKVTFLDDCPKFPEKRGNRTGMRQYPFDRLDAPGKGMEISNRSLSTVRQAARRWMDEHNDGMKLTVRVVDGKVRVRRDK